MCAVASDEAMCAVGVLLHLWNMPLSLWNLYCAAVFFSIEYEEC
jgi:hypothetical protein